MNEVLRVLNPTHGVEIDAVTVEDEYVPPPPELRETLRALGALMDLALGAPESGDDPSSSDRHYSAATVLDPSH